MGSSDDIILVAAIVAPVVAYVGNIGGFKTWADSAFKGGGGGNVAASCDQLCANGACGTYKTYCKGTCAKCATQQKVVTDCGAVCRAKGQLPSLTSTNQCLCKPVTNVPLGRCYPHPTMLGTLCYRNKCGAKEVGWCLKGGKCPQVTAAWKANACKSSARAYAYEGFDNVSIA